MRVIVNGITGKMGHIIRDLTLQGLCDSKFVCGVSPDVEVDQKTLHKSFATCNEEADVVIDFSFHEGVKDLLDFCVAKSLPVVIGTTGHTLEEKTLIANAAESIPVFYSANMSMGVAVTAELARKAAAAFPDADIEIIETHHNKKIDVPSGTALMLGNAIKEVRPQSVFNVGRPENGERTKDEIGIHSLRIGNVVGIHEVVISTGNETLTIKHEAHSRALFGEGAIRAAALLIGKEPGLYTMKDLIQ